MIDSVEKRRLCPAQVKIENGSIVAGADGTLLALDIHGRTVCTAPSPVKLPPQHDNGTYRVRFAGCSAAREIGIGGGRATDVPRFTYHYSPETIRVEMAEAKHGDVSVIRKAGWSSRFEDVVGYQRNLPPAIAEADAKELTITHHRIREW